MSLNGLAICAGIGGIELGLRLVIPNYRTVCYLERESFSAATLVARMEDETMDKAPIWDDLTTFVGRPWRGIVDIITAGFPCQPWSVAGKRAGTADDRWIWPDIARIICEVGPGYVFLENVPGLLRGGIEHVLGDLAEMGFDAEWGVFSAAECGASHKRERVFVLAYRSGEQHRQLSGSIRKERVGASGVCEELGNSNGTGHQRRGPAETPRVPFPFPPNPNDPQWSEIVGTEGLSLLKPALRRVVDGISDSLDQPHAFRQDRIRALGNAVVPVVAAVAWVSLWRVITNQ